MEKHEAELFGKMLDVLLKIVENQVSPEDAAFKRIQLVEKMRQMQEKRIPEQETNPERAHFQPKNPPISVETDMDLIESYQANTE